MHSTTGADDRAAPPFSLFARDRAGEAAETSLHRATHLRPTPTSRMFFAADNVERLQTKLRDVIRRRTGHVIDRQSDEELQVVMRYVFVQNGRHEGGIAEVRRLNELVLAEVVPIVGAGLAQYLTYMRDISNQPTPIPRGQATSIKGTKTVEVFRGL